jgi:predicted glycoside hydrolase/deacetylase ChbG (UPF0249 family)
VAVHPKQLAHVNSLYRSAVFPADRLQRFVFRKGPERDVSEVTGERVDQLREGGKGIILCADDFAVNASSSHGIVRLAQVGRISATSAMVLSPRWPEDVALLQESRGRVDVGLHLDWTSNFAHDAGHGMALGTAMARAVFGGFAQHDAQRVIERQLDAFEAHWKAPPDYVDGHQHVQQFDGIRQALVQVLLQRYASAGQPLPYVRVSRPVAGADLKSRVIAAMGADALTRLARDASLPVANGLLGIYDFSGDERAYARRMRAWLNDAPQGSIIMCHPAMKAEDDDGIGQARAHEYAYLGGAEFADALAQSHVQLVRGIASRICR